MLSRLIQTAASSPRLMLWRQASWLRLDAWLLILCGVIRDIIPKRYDPIILFIEEKINYENFLIKKSEASLP